MLKMRILETIFHPPANKSPPVQKIGLRKCQYPKKTPNQKPQMKNVPEKTITFVAQNHLDARGDCPLKREKGHNTTKKVRQKILPFTPQPTPTAAPTKKSCHAEFRKQTNRRTKLKLLADNLPATWLAEFGFLFWTKRKRTVGGKWVPFITLQLLRGRGKKRREQIWVHMHQNWWNFHHKGLAWANLQNLQREWLQD